MRGQLPDHRRGGGDERQHSAQVCDRAGGPGADGRTLNGCLRYYILPIQMSIEQFYERQLHAADLALERQRAEQRMAALERKECASGC